MWGGTGGARAPRGAGRRAGEELEARMAGHTPSTAAFVLQRVGSRGAWGYKQGCEWGDMSDRVEAGGWRLAGASTPGSVA